MAKNHKSNEKLDLFQEQSVFTSISARCDITNTRTIVERVHLGYKIICFNVLINFQLSTETKESSGCVNFNGESLNDVIYAVCRLYSCYLKQYAVCIHVILRSMQSYSCDLKHYAVFIHVIWSIMQSYSCYLKHYAVFISCYLKHYAVFIHVIWSIMQSLFMLFEAVCSLIHVIWSSMQSLFMLFEALCSLYSCYLKHYAVHEYLKQYVF